MKKSRLIGASCAVVFSFISMYSHAAIDSYTDRTAWQSAAGGGVGDILDNLDTGSQVAGVIDRGTYTSTGTAQNAFPNGNPTTTIDGTGYIRYLLKPDTYGTLTFDAPVSALGFDINPWCNGGVCDFSNSLGASVSVEIDGVASTVYLLPADDVSGFRGFISDTPFTTFTITTSSSNAWHGVDNLEAFSADADSDGVIDDVDVCPGTIIPEGVPTVKLGTNRWALVDDDFEFDTTAPKGKGPGRSYSTTDTDGCSCEQIIAALDLGKGHTKHGCSISAMDEWVALPK